MVHCPRWERDRMEVCIQIQVDMLTPEILIGVMINSKEGWKIVEKYLHNIIKSKEMKERDLQ